MEATFYGALGVAPDADEEAIVRGFREGVKQCHPDVNDSPDATAAFKRLQTARDVLTDPAERRRYDRLGHRAYLRYCSDCPGWEAPDQDVVSRAARESARAGASEATTQTRAHGRADPAPESPPHEPRQGASAAGTGAATPYYQPGQRVDPTTSGPLDTLVGVIRSLGVWTLVHGLLATSAAATGWLILTWGAFGPLSLALASFVLVAALAVSMLHVSVHGYP